MIRDEVRRALSHSGHVIVGPRGPITPVRRRQGTKRRRAQGFLDWRYEQDGYWKCRRSVAYVVDLLVLFFVPVLLTYEDHRALSPTTAPTMLCRVGAGQGSVTTLPLGFRRTRSGWERGARTGPISSEVQPFGLTSKRQSSGRPSNQDLIKTLPLKITLGGSAHPKAFVPSPTRDFRVIKLIADRVYHSS